MRGSLLVRRFVLNVKTLREFTFNESLDILVIKHFASVMREVCLKSSVCVCVFVFSKED